MLKVPSALAVLPVAVIESSAALATDPMAEMEAASKDAGCRCKKINGRRCYCCVLFLRL